MSINKHSREILEAAAVVLNPVEERTDGEARPCMELADKLLQPVQQLLPTSPRPACTLKTLGQVQARLPS